MQIEVTAEQQKLLIGACEYGARVANANAVNIEKLFPNADEKIKEVIKARWFKLETEFYNLRDELRDAEPNEDEEVEVSRNSFAAKPECHKPPPQKPIMEG